MIKTRREQEKDMLGHDKRKKCEFCENEGHYWTQDEYPDGQPQGKVVWHCQRHRGLARVTAYRAFWI